jgi:SAM-dependent methyltransferase
MRAEDFELLYKLEATYWWFVGMRQITDTVAARELQMPGIRILDAGCGTGFNLEHYSQSAREVYGLDIAADAIKRAKERGFDKIAQASVTEIPFKSDTFDLVLSFDVVCQTPVSLHDPALREIRRVLKPGGYLFIRVPAFEWLRSSHDEELNTYSRYTQTQLAEELVKSGFKVEWMSYANSFLFPVIVMRRLLKHVGIGKGTDVRPFPPGLGWLDSLFRQILVREAGWFKSGKRMPFGLSVIGYARKAGAHAG